MSWSIDGLVLSVASKHQSDRVLTRTSTTRNGPGRVSIFNEGGYLVN